MNEAGYSLLALLATVTIMLIVMSATVPTWRYIMKNEKEEELLFRGGQIANAIAAYQEKNGKAYPPSLEVLVKGKYLRKLYKDPMTKDGQWRLIHGGLPGGAAPERPPRGPGSQPGESLGPISGVQSRSTEKSLRVVNGRSRYDEWIFTPGPPRVIGHENRRIPGPKGLPTTPGPTLTPSPSPEPPDLQ